MSDQIIIIAGQSNALGFGNVGAAEYQITPRVEIWTDTNHNGVWDIGDNFNMMVPGLNTGTAANPTAWGPEVEIAKEWLADNATGILWIGKSVHGETGLAKGPGLDWSPESRGEMYDQATQVARAMQANLGVDHMDAMFWMQGETDAESAKSAASYAANFADLLAHAREDWHVKTAIAGRIADAQPDALLVRQAQWQVDQSDDHLVTVRTLGFEMQADGVHYDATGQMQLGHALYEGWVV